MKARLKTTLRSYALNPVKRTYMKRFLRKNDVRIVLAEYGSTGAEVLEMCQELQIPLVVHFHGSDAYSKENLRNYREVYKRMFVYSSAIIAVSRHMVAQLAGLGAPEEKIVYNPYGVEVAKFKQTSPAALPRQVVAVGRFVEKKAPYLTILAFKKVLGRIPEAKLAMVGSGGLHDVCRQLIRSLHMEHAVDLKGVMDHDQVASLMQQSRVFVQHSLVPMSGDSEGTPVSVIEASASALPIVSTRHAGIIDAVIEGKTGFLVDEGDIDGMAEHLCQLLENREMAAEMGRQGREHISQNFTGEVSLKRLKDLLDQHSL